MHKRFLWLGLFALIVLGILSIPDKTKAEIELTNQVHGPFTTNASSCNSCHSTHASWDDKLIGQPDNVNDGLPNDAGKEKLQSKSTALCMSCHDGTGAQLATHMDKEHVHVKPMVLVHEEEDEGANETVDLPYKGCVSCHNPHGDTIDHEGNPLNEFLLKSDRAGGWLNYEYGKDALDDKRLSRDKDPFGLCLSCHTSGVEEDARPVSHLVYDSMNSHTFKSVDGEQILPCQVCHDKHGSDNPQLLQEKFGTANGGNVEWIGRDRLKELTGPSASSADLEEASAEIRKYCSGCHNGTTEVYGITVKEAPPTWEGHAPTDTESCTTCHSGGRGYSNMEEAFFHAVHNPSYGAMRRSHD